MNEEIELTEEDFEEVFIIPKHSTMPDEFAFLLIPKMSKLEKLIMHTELFREKLREATGL